MECIAADVGWVDDAGVGVDKHAAAHHPDSRVSAVPQAALEGEHPRGAEWDSCCP